MSSVHVFGICKYKKYASYIIKGPHMRYCTSHMEPSIYGVFPPQIDVCPTCGTSTYVEKNGPPSCLMWCSLATVSRRRKNRQMASHVYHSLHSLPWEIAKHTGPIYIQYVYEEMAAWWRANLYVVPLYVHSETLV